VCYSFVIIVHVYVEVGCTQLYYCASLHIYYIQPDLLIIVYYYFKSM